MFQDKIKQILSQVDQVIELSKAEATQSIYGRSKQRIFNFGEDKAETQIGKYKPSYVKVRKKKGLQTSFVDLKVTGSLQASIERNQNQVFFKNDYGKKISTYNEQNFNKRIFAPSAKERQIFFDILNENLNDLINGS